MLRRAVPVTGLSESRVLLESDRGALLLPATRSTPARERACPGHAFFFFCLLVCVVGVRNSAAGGTVFLGVTMFWIAPGLMISAVWREDLARREVYDCVGGKCVSEFLADTECALAITRLRRILTWGGVPFSRPFVLRPDGAPGTWDCLDAKGCRVARVFLRTGACGYKPSFLVTMQCLSKMYSNLGLGRVRRTNKLLLRLVL
jgi:hypothetical protein